MPVTLTDNYGTTISLAMPDEQEVLSLDVLGGGVVNLTVGRPEALGPIGVLRIGVSALALGAAMVARTAVSRVSAGAVALGAAVAARVAPSAVGTDATGAGAAIGVRTGVSGVGVSLGVPSATVVARSGVAGVGVNVISITETTPANAILDRTDDPILDRAGAFIEVRAA